MPAAEYTVLSKAAVIERANSVRRDNFVSDDASIEVLRLVQKLNGTVNINGGAEETLNVNPDKTFVINLPKNTSSVRDVFTIAHELGHFFLHTNFKREGTAKFNRYGSSRSETEANWFAAELLMPRDRFIEVALESGFDHRMIATHFGVSGAAVRVRMSVLGISDSANA
ncbi:MAG: ImmA/IrrE family metallo-endopeptidase [Solidesulfovibrio sp.]|uniref:ImmA/IrrE family metallo-endopeptidase n=1 Tax=Solidesulfovibrio sp. TaxID=2910990 RepID=UPI002B21C476|nr:ImmA/IrrE family metallo-endopeptidase [Solidesulfovibrio sp.]MEA4858332.1 ImmA/IrrE family metallo-endopeptidase [Solidesulfovibrio sp.]